MTVPVEKPPLRKKIWILVFPDFLLLDATGPAQVFASTNDECRDTGRAPHYAIELVSRQGGAIASCSGVTVLTRALPSAAALRGATLIVAGGAGIHAALTDNKLIRWVARAPASAQRCASVCTGAFLLAEAGLLRHRRAVTHWQDAEQLQQRYPEVQVQEDAIYVKDGAVYTSAGITAGIDLCLSLVEEDLGRTVALNVAKRLVVYHKRPGGQRQFSSELLVAASGSDMTAQLVAWLRPRVREDIDVDRMAAAVAVSPRSLHRRLQQELGQSPAALLARVRMEVACRMLESGAYSVKQVAGKSGFGSEYNLRRAFAKHLGVLPTEYRERFG